MSSTFCNITVLIISNDNDIFNVANVLDEVEKNFKKMSTSHYKLMDLNQYN